MIQTGQYLGTLSKLTLKSGAENPGPPPLNEDERNIYGQRTAKICKRYLHDLKNVYQGNVFSFFN